MKPENLRKNTFSHYLAQNAVIRSADKVLRYRDHEISRCKDDIP